MTRYLVTGSTGFIGSQLVDRLDGDVFGLVRWTHEDRQLDGFRPMFGDLRDYRDIEQVVRSVKPDVVFHLGAISPVSESFDRPHEYLATNATGTMNLVEACLDHIPHLDRFVFAGTPEEYGIQAKYPTPPDAPVHPQSPYGVSKVAASKYVAYAARAYDFPGVISRHANCYGRAGTAHFVVEAIISQMLENDDTVRLGNPEPVREFLYVDDVLAAYEAMASRGQPGTVYNFAGEAVSIQELADMCRDATGYLGKIEWNTRPRRPGEIPRIELDDSATREELSWQPELTLSEGIKRVADVWGQRAVAVADRGHS